MLFKDYLMKANAEEREFDCVIGGVDMPATTVGNPDMKITPYMEKKYSLLLNSDVIDEREDYCEVLYPKYQEGRNLILALAGYCSEKEYEKLTGIKSTII